MVFFSSCASVKYHAELFNYVDIPVKDIHGKQKQQKRTATFFEFCQVGGGTVLGGTGLDCRGRKRRAGWAALRMWVPWHGRAWRRG